MNIDWIEGATHYGIGDDCPVFFRNIIKGESYEFKNVYSSGVMASWLKCTGYIDIPNSLVERPKKQEAWDGEGLPPVGTVCEVLWNESRMEYLITKVFGVNEHGQPIHRFDEGPKKYQYQADVLRTASGTQVFRPIKTAEQLAEEEKVAAIAEMRAVLMAASDRKSVTLVERLATVALYDAGYRKQ